MRSIKLCEVVVPIPCMVEDHSLMVEAEDTLSMIEALVTDLVASYSHSD